MTNRSIKVDYISRLEGEAALDVNLVNGTIESLKLNVFEPPRFFQNFLVGRKYRELPDITARICGICPVSYQMTSINAIEHAFDVEVSEQTRLLRKLFALSQFIQSHVLHVFMLAAPDFLGYESVISMAEDFPDEVKLALDLKRLGNDITALIGGREVHPVTPRVGGFSDLPSQEALKQAAERLEAALEGGMAAAKLVGGLSVPDMSWDFTSVALSDKKEYAVNGGRLVSDNGLDIDPADYREFLHEAHVSPSHALHSSLSGNSFLVGPLARVNLNFDRLSGKAKEAAALTGVSFPSKNPFHSVDARVAELVHSIEESLEIIDALGKPVPEKNGYIVRPGCGAAITEAPRGILSHSYCFNELGVVEEADIVAPTSRNVKNMEEGLRRFIPEHLDLSDEELTLKCEMYIRNYDPCFSCSVHFLKLRINR
ncbi:Ni/Fe hydrogenase subunit alpha [Dethiobacter alkaliphilus]|uniref:Nickel-dependent hydrogenase large subunit n=1 Tax=Dethiobacter alkaliphilus AHT 1 TaxID=555088 RepID=C0GED6_DETAL|nr:Ni/Fe hydrogenase subunit alpha [Dethiobacter alkaliphilus]EEG78430.1 nickel-dependent hydrogenase large subunit [Dethiobacter alkaliphilus AHT 1]